MNGFSYENVYYSEKHKEFMNSQRYVTDEKYLDETESHELSDGFSAKCNIYIDMERKTEVQKITLKNADRIIYEYYCFYNHPSIFKQIIHHKNGHRYYAFHVDLYGISFLDVDTMEVYNYIPEGCQHDDKYMCGESFIITDVHYDRESNLIAYGGCYWATPYDVMVGDFSNPLNFNPHLISLRDISGFGYYLYDDVDFKEWKDNKLYITCDEKNEKFVGIEELQKLINELTMKGK